MFLRQEGHASRCDVCVRHDMHAAHVSLNKMHEIREYLGMPVH
jgi:hypothetical protein